MSSVQQRGTLAALWVGMSKTTDRARLAQLRDKEDNDERLTAKETAEYRAILKRNSYLNRCARVFELDLSRD